MTELPLYKVRGTGIDGPVFQEFDTQEDVTLWLDALLSRTSKFHLISELNELQCACIHTGEGGVRSFPNKFTIPLEVVNLFLKEYGLKIEH